MRDFALEVHFSRWEFNVRYNLTASDAESLSIAQLLEMADSADREAFESLQLGYTETFGAAPLRGVISETYDTVTADDILCLAGAGEGIYIAMQVLLEPEDHVVVITPNYQSAETVPLSICTVSGAPLDAENNWALDLGRVRDSLRPNTKLISINFPNNPTGAIPSRTEIDELVALCRERDIWLFSDEVYRLIERDRSLRIPQIADIYEKGISLNVMSKAYGLPGLRIGWIACRDHEMLVRFERLKHYLSICNSGPSEALALIALRARQQILERNRKLVNDNVRVAGEFFVAHPDIFDWMEPDGGCVSFIRYKGANGVEEFTRRLVEEAGVLLLPSSIYTSEVSDVPRNHFRIGLGRSFVPEAVEVLQGWIAANPG
jgi:aspartate/methionine/tyrosine aminotransferase